MWIILPIGHDQPVYDRPWLTFGLILACSGIWLASFVFELRANADLMSAAADIDRVHQAYPGARIRFTVDGLPSHLESQIAPLFDADPNRPPTAGDEELGDAMIALVNGMNRHPVLRFGYRPGRPTVGSAIAYMFMHGGLFHLLGNMLFLFVAGGVLECFWRRWAYGLLYLASGFAGLAAHHLSAPDSLAPLVGASGAVAGLIGAYIVSYPKSRIRLGYFFLILFKPVYGSWYVRAWIVIPLWAGMELASALLMSGDGVAYWAHVGGFGCGLVVGIVSRLMGWVAVDDGRQGIGLPDP